MNINLSYSKYEKCQKCSLIYKENSEHTAQDCRKQQMENYIKKRIRKGVIKGMFYSLLIIYSLGAGSLVCILLTSINHIVKLNAELTETNLLDKRIMSGFAEAIENINKQ